MKKDLKYQYGLPVNIGDTVYAMYERRLRAAIVDKITVEMWWSEASISNPYEGTRYSVSYDVNIDGKILAYSEFKLYPSHEDFVKDADMGRGVRFIPQDYDIKPNQRAYMINGSGDSHYGVTVSKVEYVFTDSVELNYYRKDINGEDTRIDSGSIFSSREELLEYLSRPAEPKSKWQRFQEWINNIKK